MKVDKLTNITWVLPREQALKYMNELRTTHAILPQPASRSVRSLLITLLTKGTMATLTYTTEHGDVLFEYSIIEFEGVDDAVCAYEGPLKDFGFGDVGPFMGIHHRTDINFARATIE